MVRFTSMRKCCSNDGQPPDDLLEDVEEVNEEDEEEDDEWESDEDAASTLEKKRVVFKGTYPIDRPVVARSLTNVRKRQQMTLTLKPPRTYVIDEPVGVVGVEKKGHMVEVSIRLDRALPHPFSLLFLLCSSVVALGPHLLSFDTARRLDSVLFFYFFSLPCFLLNTVVVVDVVVWL